MADKPTLTPEQALKEATGDHEPVLIEEIIEQLAPKSNQRIVDGTFGAGGYSRRLLDAAECAVIGIDQDPDALDFARLWAPLYVDRLSLVAGNFADMDELIDQPVDAVVLDIGVSSMQLDRARRGFSFLRDGPLDMRMSQNGPSAADIVNEAEEAELADILFQYGEERRSRAMAKAIIAARSDSPIETTGRLAEVISEFAPRKKPGQPHPATRAFQALRIAVNDELGALMLGLSAAERLLKPGGRLAVVTFHSLEDRIVKRFLQARSDAGGAGVSRHMPQAPTQDAASLTPLTRRAITPTAAEIAANPRARSAKLRVAERTDAPARPLDPKGMGLPGLALRALEVGR